jgi:hypothetical protein
VLDSASLELRRYKTRADITSKKKSAVDVIKLDSVARITEDVEQPEVDEGEESAAEHAGSTFVTRFDFIMKDDTARSFIAFNPEDSRYGCVTWGCAVWVSVSSTAFSRPLFCHTVCG